MQHRNLRFSAKFCSLTTELRSWDYPHLTPYLQIYDNGVKNCALKPRPQVEMIAFDTLHVIYVCVDNLDDNNVLEISRNVSFDCLHFKWTRNISVCASAPILSVSGNRKNPLSFQKVSRTNETKFYHCRLQTKKVRGEAWEKNGGHC